MLESIRAEFVKDLPNDYCMLKQLLQVSTHVEQNDLSLLHTYQSSQLRTSMKTSPLPPALVSLKGLMMSGLTGQE